MYKRQVLGDNQKPDDSTRFIVKKTDAVKLFGNADVDFPEYYEVNSEAFMRIDAYALSLIHILQYNMPELFVADGCDIEI